MTSMWDVRCSAVYSWTPNVATRGVLTHFENTKNHFRPGLRPGPRWGSSRRSHRPHSPLGRGIPPPHSSTPWTPSASRFSYLPFPTAPRNSTPLASWLGASILFWVPPPKRIFLATRLNEAHKLSSMYHIFPGHSTSIDIKRAVWSSFVRVLTI